MLSAFKILQILINCSPRYLYKYMPPPTMFEVPIPPSPPPSAAWPDVS